VAAFQSLPWPLIHPTPPHLLITNTTTWRPRLPLLLFPHHHLLNQVPGSSIAAARLVREGAAASGAGQQQLGTSSRTVGQVEAPRLCPLPHLARCTAVLPPWGPWCNRGLPPTHPTVGPSRAANLLPVNPRTAHPPAAQPPLTSQSQPAPQQTHQGSCHMPLWVVVSPQAHLGHPGARAGGCSGGLMTYRGVAVVVALTVGGTAGQGRIEG
jgi:hypothetical protein